MSVSLIKMLLNRFSRNAPLRRYLESHANSVASKEDTLNFFFDTSTSSTIAHADVKDSSTGSTLVTVGIELAPGFLQKQFTAAVNHDDGWAECQQVHTESAVATYEESFRLIGAVS